MRIRVIQMSDAVVGHYDNGAYNNTSMPTLPTDKIISCFYNSSEDCVKVINPDGILMSFNPNGLKVMEIDNEKDVLGKDWLAFWNGEMEGKAATALLQASAGKLAHFEGYCPTFKGTMKYWEVSLAPLINDYGDVQWILVTSRDMTKYKDMELVLEKQRNEIEQLRHAAKH